MHYALLYLMLLCNQSVAQQHFPPFFPYLILGISLLMFLWIGSIEKRTTLLLIFLFIMTVVLNITTNGGIGPSHWVNWATMILLTLLCVYMDTEMVLERYLNLVLFLSAVSVFFFAWQILNIESLKRIFLIHGELLQKYETFSYFQWEVTSSFEHYKYDGLLLYVVNGMNVNRNVGLYTEPGVYQMVINSAIFLLLFEMKQFPYKKRKIYLMIYIVALITTQSTTGYIACVAIILTYFWVHDRRIVNQNIKVLILRLVFCLGVLCIIDVVFRRENSILYNIVIGKITGATNELGTEIVVATSSGGARLGTSFLAIKTILLEPFGVGYSRMSEILDTATTGFVGAEFLVMGAALGVIPFIGIMCWMFMPILQSVKLNSKIKILLVFLILNTLIAQSAVFYPALILIPIYYYTTRNMNI